MENNKTILRFFDFDGCLFDTPLPDEGKEQWSNFYNKPYPHKGWWGRMESMDLVCFHIPPRKEVYKIYNDGKGENVIDFILTSRLLRFEPIIKELLKLNDIDIKDEHILTKNKFEKGERIFQTALLFKDLNITDIYFYDDRDKEINSANEWKESIEDLGINFHIKKIY